MFGKLFNTGTKRAKVAAKSGAKRKLPLRLELEALEQRELMSANYVLGGPAINLTPHNSVGARWDGGHYFGSGASNTYRSALENPSNFGPHGVVPIDIDTRNLASVNATTLAKMNGFISSIWSEGDQGVAEAEALVDFFLKGGDLITVTNASSHAGQWFLQDRIGKLLGVPSSVYAAESAATGTGPLFQGPFGTIANLPAGTPQDATAYLKLSDIQAHHGHVGATNAQGQVIAAYWHQNEYAPGAGRLFMFTDFNRMILTTSAAPQFLPSLNNAGKFALNATAFIVGSQAASFQVSAPSAVTAGGAFQVTVTALDATGHVATGYRGTTHFSSNDVQAGLPANYTFTADDKGVRKFNVTLKTAGTRTVTATDTATNTITGNVSTLVKPGEAVDIVTTAYPSPITAGVAGSFTITALDAYGNIATGYRNTLNFSSTDPKAVLPANYTFTAADNGDHTFSVTLKTAGTQRIVGQDITNGTSYFLVLMDNIVVNPAAASVLFVNGFPSPVAAGAANNITVTAKDAYGNIAKGYRGTVKVTSSDAQAVLPANYTFTASDNGVHALSATLKTAATQSFTVKDTVTASITGSQTGIAVNAAAAKVFVVNGFPSPVNAGVAGNVVVTAKDAYGNTATGYRGTVSFASSDSQAALPANYTFTASDNGKHTFSATLKTAGSQSLTAKDTANSNLTGTQSGITVNAAVAKTLLLSGFPSPTDSGVAHNLTITAKDAFGNVAKGYRGTVKVTSSDAQAVLPANYTFTANDNGVHNLSATLKTVGSQSLTAKDTVTATITGTQSGITIVPAAASTFVVSGYPTPTTAGAARNFTVTAKDAQGNVVVGYVGTVTFTSSDAQAGLPANYTFTTSDKGVHTFSATLKTAGTQSLTVKDKANSSIAGTQSGIVVHAAAASSFIVNGFPSPITAGVAGNVTITAKDAFGNTAIGYTGTVKLTSSDNQAVLPANYTFTSTDKGVHKLSATLKTAGSQALTATDTAAASITATQSGITVNPAAAKNLVVGGFPSSTNANVAHDVTITAKDAFGNVATGYRGTVKVTSSDAQAALPANYTFVASDNGVHNLSVTLKTAGTQSITAKDTVTATITGTQSGIVVNAAVASAFVVSGFPTPTTAGVSGNFTVTAKDAQGNVVAGYVGTVTFSSSDSQAGLPANYTFTANDHGVHTFSATLKTAGSQSLTVKDTATASIAGTQSGIVVNPAAASTLVVNGFPSPTDAGAAHNVTVTAKDAFGNVATGYRGAVKFTSSDAQAVLPANYTFTATDNGKHDFSVTLKTAGTQSITAKDTANASLSGSQSGIQVNATAPLSTMIVGPLTGVRGQPLAYTLGVNQPGSFTFAIDINNDGTAEQTVNGPDGTKVDVIFPVAGSFTMKVTATGGGASATAIFAVVIAEVALQSDPNDASKTTLVIGGTTAADLITVTPVDTTSLSVAVNGTTYGPYQPNTRILVYGQAGDDQITLASGSSKTGIIPVTLPALIHAGAGADRVDLSGSTANNVAAGDADNDTLIGGAGRDLLIGGAGTDKIESRAGDDILIGGTTAYDLGATGAYRTKLTALDAVMKEWNRTDLAYQGRVDHLRGAVSGGLNGTTRLDASSVLDDNAVDTLLGQGDLDWFFAKTSGAAADLVNDLSAGEVKTAI